LPSYFRLTGPPLPVAQADEIHGTLDARCHPQERHMERIFSPGATENDRMARLCPSGLSVQSVARRAARRMGTLRRGEVRDPNQRWSIAARRIAPW
jgi:hypothetical protein